MLHEYPRLTLLTTGLAVFLMAFHLYSLLGWQGYLDRDSGVYLYAGQQLAQGIPPYLSIFDIVTPMTHLTTGGGVWLAKFFSLDDIYLTRIIFTLIGCSSVVVVYLLSQTLFSSLQMGLLAAFWFLSYSLFGITATYGITPKTPAVLFEILYVLFAVQRRWFWAGFCSTLAFLTWQPLAVYVIISIFFILAQTTFNKNRLKNLIQFSLGALIPICLVSLYFLYLGALPEFAEMAFFFYKYTGGISSPLLNLDNLITSLYIDLREVISIVLGLMMIGLMFIWRLRNVQNNRLLFLNDPFAIFFLSSCVPWIWSSLDYQRGRDFLFFLPYISIGLAWLFRLVLVGLRGLEPSPQPILSKVAFVGICLALLGAEWIIYSHSGNQKLIEQKRWGHVLELIMGAEGRFLSIGTPEALVLLHRSNPNAYPFLLRNYYKKIETTWPGGFEAWLNQLEHYNPTIIGYGPTGPDKIDQRIQIWLRANYPLQTRIGEWLIFVNPTAFEKASNFALQPSSLSIKQALPLFSQLASLPPNDAQLHPVYFGLGQFFYTQNDFETATEFYQQAIKLQDKDYLPYKEMAKIYLQSGQPKVAQAEFEQALTQLKQTIQAEPANSDNWLVLAHLLIEAASYDAQYFNQSISAYERVIELKPALLTIEDHYSLALAYQYQNLTPQAIVYFQKVIELNPDHPLSHQAQEYLRKLKQ